jgi:hypothetical protein
MRRLLLLPLVLLLGACNSDKIAQLEKRNKELAARLDSLSNGSLLDLQGRCASQSRSIFKDQGPWSKGVSVTYTNHYNQRLGKCFIEIHATTPGKQGIFASTWISDAFERKDYGEYYAVVSHTPTSCTIRSLAGEETSCQSEEEFTEAMKQYME